MRGSASARNAVKRTLQKIGKSYGHWFRPAPVLWAKLDPCGQVLAPSVFFSFGPCTARFLFFCAQKKRKWGVHSQHGKAVRPRPRPRRTSPVPLTGGTF